MKRLWCNADTEMISVFSSIMVILRWKKKLFFNICICAVSAQSIYYYCNNLFLYPSSILASSYGIISSYVDCTDSFLGCYDVEKRIDKSTKFLDLDGNMLMQVGCAEIIVPFHLLF